ncbi:acyltransferase family protein [Pseudomonas sp. TE3610]
MVGLGYRRDIDGLRALAVSMVVLFHYGIPGFTGGFVGVDVFFIISGYLITSIIWRQREAGQFSFIDFWTRRARRILPALFTVMACCLALGWWLLTPDEYVQLGRSVLYQAMFASNILFRSQDGYFETASDLKPLLHTWSLSVEEQFYIVFPLLLGLLIRFSRHWRWWLLALALLSLALSIRAVDRHPAAAFFLLHMRAWELLAGGLLAVLPTGRRVMANWICQAASLVGLAMLALATFTYDQSTAFPGLAALLPVLGTLAIIWASGQQPTWVGRLLGSKVLVGIGLISYSWYLWHWPVHVFARYAAVDGLTGGQVFVLLVLSLLLAYVSWRWVEQPFRRMGSGQAPRKVLACALGALLMLGFVGKGLVVFDGVPTRLSDQALRYADAAHWNDGQMQCMSDKKTARPMCTFGPPTANTPSILVWGDSHAAGLEPALRMAARAHGQAASLASRSGCIPVPALEAQSACRHFNERTLEHASAKEVTDVVIAARWSLYLYGDERGDDTQVIRAPGSRAVDSVYAEKQLQSHLQALVTRLRAGGRRVWLVKEAPLQKHRVPHQLSRLAMLGRAADGQGRPLADHLARQAFIDRLFRQMAEADPQVKVIDPTPALCAEGGICRMEAGGESLYMDDNHYSDGSGAILQPVLAPLFEQGALSAGAQRIGAYSSQ